jgi:hypothetical protein
MKASELRERARRYSQMAMKITDDRLLEALAFFSAQYTRMADALERRRQRADLKDRIRARAHEIWKERGCPPGRDVEHWLAAEQELVGEEKSEDPYPKREAGQGCALAILGNISLSFLDATHQVRGAHGVGSGYV